MTWYERLHSLRIDDRLISLAQFYDVSMDYISGASDIRKPYETL